MTKITAGSILPPMDAISGRRRQLIWTRRLLASFLAAAVLCGAVHAENRHEEACYRVGTLAAAVARARDSGLPQAAAVSTVKTMATPAEEPVLVEVAKLLYERFRQMSADSAEFEFMLDCLDNADQS